ncbi:MAG TPA: helix-turn-helix domain-containing protein [Jatrophihabitans sp.]|nr:helix-turn-helix domain-containing protein [Jatrophihabitans sp.]
MNSQRAASPGPSRRPDPLVDIVLCPTTGRALPVGAPAPDAAPDPSRASVARRSRAAILDGARAAVLANGTAITMAQIAARAGVAKATLYNHFRAREDVLAELLLAEIDGLIDSVSHLPLPAALTQAAVAISEHPLLEALGESDLLALSVLGRVDVRSAGWARVAQATERLLARRGRRGTPTVLRWLASFVTAPAEAADIAADVSVLVAGLPPAR